MQTLLFWLAVINAVIVVPIVVVAYFGGRSITQLVDVQPRSKPPDGSDAWPLVSIVVSARNEEQNIEPALRSLVAQDYPHLQYLVVDDRSTDATGAIVDRLAEEFSQLKIVHLHELPAGWLGKNHAMQRGIEQSDGEFILLTDADVVMEPTTLRRAVGYMLANRLDHLPMGPHVEMPNWALESFAVTFFVFLSIYARPWKAKDPKSSAAIGIGAFNLIRAEVLRAVGGIKPLAMRPDDDIKLGKLIKQNGYRQEYVGGAGTIGVPWYGSLGEVLVGLEKNTFAAVGYSITAVVLVTALIFFLNVWPFVAVCLPIGGARWINAAVVLSLLGLSYQAASDLGARKSCALGFPLFAALMIYIQWRSMLLTLIRGGIRWRDTFYPLRELKANKV